MTQPDETFDAAHARIERAGDADDETRLEILEALYGELEAELERDVEPFPGATSE